MKKSNLLFLLILTILLTFGLIAGCGGSGGSGSTPDSPGNNGGGPGDSTGDLIIKVYFDYSNNRLNISIKDTSPKLNISNFTADNITLSGMSGVQKGTLTRDPLNATGMTYIEGHGYVDGYHYFLPISGHRNGSLIVSINIPDMEGTRWIGTATVEIRSGGGQSNVPDGIYLGIIKFSSDTQAINLKQDNSYNPGNQSNSGAPVLLDYDVINNFSSRLQNQYQNVSTGGSAIYYAVHKALANLKSSENSLPANPDSVYLITFTDGNDNGSTGQSSLNPIENRSFSTASGYMEYIRGEIANRKINGKEITAYSIGIRGSDVTDLPGFTTFLQNIASPNKSKVASSFSDVNSTFDEIADGLIQGSDFIMTTTLLESGTKVRMTFDITSSNQSELIHSLAVTSAKYIEGTVSTTGSGQTLTYIFTVTSYAGGISSGTAVGSTITGTINRSDGTVQFRFENITGYNYATDSGRTKQWLMAPGQTLWQINSEYVSAKADFGNTIIYLVLDCSPSLTATNISNIRTYVNNFVTKIYNARY